MDDAPLASVIDTPDLATDDGAAAVRLVLRGRLDSRRAPEVHRAARVAAARGRDVILDLGEATFVGIASLQVLLALRAALRAADRCMRIESVPDDVATLVALCGLREVLKDH